MPALPVKPPRLPRALVASAALGLGLVGCGSSDGGGLPPGDVGARWEQIVDGLAAPVHAAALPGDPRLFVVEKRGVIRVVKDGAALAEPFLDLGGLVVADGFEQGLFSIAFHPRFAENGRCFVFYTGSNGDLFIAEYAVPAATPDRADPTSGRILLSIEHRTAQNHNGGQLAFGPDGYLYAGVGDGGGRGDPEGDAQNPASLLGKLLRLDVDVAAPHVPASNPGLAAPLVWAYGLRNPWRFSFDRETGDLYIGDVGQSEWEEIDFQPAASTGGENYGWNLMEGNGHCFTDPNCLAPELGLVRPIAEYPNGEDCAVTGGFVYRGAALPELRGTYLYGDYCSGEILSLRMAGGVATDQASLTEALGGALPGLASFGEDGAGELLAVQLEAGRVLRLVPR